MEDQTWIKWVAGGHHHVVIVWVFAQTIHGNSIPDIVSVFYTAVVITFYEFMFIMSLQVVAEEKTLVRVIRPSCRPELKIGLAC